MHKISALLSEAAMGRTYSVFEAAACTKAVTLGFGVSE
jgi:hypothetical protein